MSLNIVKKLLTKFSPTFVTDFVVYLVITKFCDEFVEGYARIGFQLEKAFWRYINQFEEEKVASLENYFQLKDFALQIFP